MSPLARSPRRGFACAVAAVALVASGCTGTEDIASAADAADAFIAAWGARDGRRMHALFDRASAGEWQPAELEAYLRRTLTAGAIDSYQVKRSGNVEGPSEEEIEQADGEPVTVAVPYAITYSSDAVEGPLTLDGSFQISYSEEADQWSVHFDKGLLWPGIEGAVRFDVATRWLKRGRILDRSGRVLARGTGRRRSYPLGDLAGSTIGHVEALTKKTLPAASEGHEVGDLVGASGLEAAYEDRLAGTPSEELRVVGRRGRVLESLGRSKGVAGRAVRAALDARVQQAAAIAFGGTVGGAVVIQPRSGDLLAAVTAYEVDPNNLVGVADVSPFNRALSGLYPPGSAMKVVTAGAALDTGVVTPITRLTGPKEYQGVRNFESASYSSLDFATAVKFSVNTAFAQVAQKLGAKRLLTYARAFGFNREPSMPLEAATSSFPFPQDESDLMWGSIGQAQDLATPLQMATVAATVANGGVRLEPRSSIDDPKDPQRVLSRKTARTLTGLMESVVEGGTGVNARIAGVRVAGKTGTAEVDVNGKRKNHAWFICFAPVEDPEVAVAVVSEYGGVGGQVAAPIARGMLQGVLPLVQK
jgi:peptidoglycan glycosyltransferase